ncbi:hypothetical protein MGN01_36280 [Methylobacterium gnaphalii]|uniref:Uncharacterized protein n=2 Tax=Methylobacterium gnaphalii TaxID=1010610 RepID=A0A512JPJ2_9HYPH|nr:hypothetical protein MGN01_36280 [Methylobacterium gnaphalii]GLS49582.1 hypothetical protein GCM10007885_24310 [Methylobacterium gnaphalii]
MRLPDRMHLREAARELSALPALKAERDQLAAEVVALRARKPGHSGALPAVVSPSSC